MNRKGLKLLILLGLLAPLLAGCWSRRELDELAISSAFGLDKEETGTRYRFRSSTRVPWRAKRTEAAVLRS
ncbi:hypothetical protein N6H14_03340 [Paenibacillus sp. CC-CFT747]|nr:hypothetical protein N6H14_03340 [Paenibacillus sp. CC-CFT747]